MPLPKDDNTARYENILGHVFPPLSVVAIEKLHMVRCGNTENHQTMAQRMARGIIRAKRAC